MKTITQLILIVIILVPIQLLAQEVNESKTNPNTLLQERIISKSIPNEQIKHLPKTAIFKDKESRTIVNETMLDNGFLLIEELIEDWLGSDWVNSGKYIYTYDGKNNMIEELIVKWLVPNWLNYWKYTYAYDANNNVIEELSQKWDVINWVNSGKYTYTYDGNNLIEELRQRWNGSNWSNSIKYTYTYDGNNNWIERLYEYWMNNNWEIVMKDICTYDGNNNRIMRINYDWIDSNWVAFAKDTTTYDGNNNCVEWECKLWENPNWVNWWKQIYTYDENNNHIETLDLDWTGSSWVNTLKYSMTFDEHNNRIEMLIQNWAAGQWWNFRRYTYTYQSTTRIERMAEGIKTYSLSNNYPNPFNPVTKIDFTLPEKSKVRLSVLNILGQEISLLVNEEKAAGYHTIDFNASDLPSGVYFYQLRVSALHSKDGKAGPLSISSKGQAGQVFINTKKMILLR